MAPGASCAAHQHAPVVRRAEVVEEHAPVGDRLAARPAEALLQQVGYRLRQDDVGAELRERARGGAPAGECRVRREHDVAGADRPFGRLHDSVAHAGGGCVLVGSLDARGERPPAERPRESSRLHGRAFAEEDAAAEPR